MATQYSITSPSFNYTNFKIVPAPHMSGNDFYSRHVHIRKQSRDPSRLGKKAALAIHAAYQPVLELKYKLDFWDSIRLQSSAHSIAAHQLVLAQFKWLHIATQQVNSRRAWYTWDGALPPPSSSLALSNIAKPSSLYMAMRGTRGRTLQPGGVMWMVNSEMLLGKELACRGSMGQSALYFSVFFGFRENFQSTFFTCRI
ncbi:hypothetical protein WOLCODRAFT_15987 [Wolfiporia cocos MD-104 SS10]|uniref:Uncharacterized protein n=1 Tax=Wolfiporia cocos (strain MD-104) TaxID=742152 RepID=A0A2H3JAN6_WOLCO|nr:hypothetical protein WOLCODRAFT_15987 [Wolfiporia cocos MD-104 SS10]